MTEQAILNRIQKLETRQRKNGRIIRKLYRKLRAIQKSAQIAIEGDQDE